MKPLRMGFWGACFSSKVSHKFPPGCGGFGWSVNERHSWSPNGQVLSMHRIASPLAHPLTFAWVCPPPPRFPAGLGMASAVDEQSQQRHLVAFLLSGVEKQNSYMEMFCFFFFFICFVFFKCMLHCLSYCVLLGVVHIRIEYSLNKLSSLNFSGGHVKDLNFPSFWALEATFTVLFMFLHHL